MKLHGGQLILIAQSGSCFLIEMDVQKPVVVDAAPLATSQNHLQAPPSFQPLGSQIMSRSEYSCHDEDDAERYDEKDLRASRASSLGNYARKKASRKFHQSATSQPQPHSSSSSSQPAVPPPRPPLPIVSYTLSDVMLNCCLYAGHEGGVDRETVLGELTPRCRSLLSSRSDAATSSIVAKALSSLKSINLIILDLDPQVTSAPDVLMGKIRKMGYCGFAILLSDVPTSPDSSDRFLRCGGDGILFRPVVNLQAVHRVLIGTSETSLISLFTSPPSPLPEAYRLQQKSSVDGDYFQRKTAVMYLQEKELEI